MRSNTLKDEVCHGGAIDSLPECYLSVQVDSFYIIGGMERFFQNQRDVHDCLAEFLRQFCLSELRNALCPHPAELVWALQSFAQPAFSQQSGIPRANQQSPAPVACCLPEESTTCSDKMMTSRTKLLW